MEDSKQKIIINENESLQERINEFYELADNISVFLDQKIKHSELKEFNLQFTSFVDNIKSFYIFLLNEGVDNEDIICTITKRVELIETKLEKLIEDYSNYSKEQSYKKTENKWMLIDDLAQLEFEKLKIFNDVDDRINNKTIAENTFIPFWKRITENVGFSSMISTLDSECRIKAKEHILKYEPNYKSKYEIVEKKAVRKAKLKRITIIIAMIIVLCSICIGNKMDDKIRKLETQLVDFKTKDKGIGYDYRYIFEFTMFVNNKTSNDIVELDGIISIVNKNNEEVLSANTRIRNIKKGAYGNVILAIECKESQDTIRINQGGIDDYTIYYLITGTYDKSYNVRKYNDKRLLR